MARNLIGPTGTAAAPARPARAGDTLTGLPRVVGLDLTEPPDDPEAVRHARRAGAALLSVVAALAVALGGLHASAQREGAEVQAAQLGDGLARVCARFPGAAAAVGANCDQAEAVARGGVADYGLGALAAGLDGSGPLGGDVADGVPDGSLSGPGGPDVVAAPAGTPLAPPTGAQDPGGSIPAPSGPLGGGTAPPPPTPTPTTPAAPTDDPSTTPDPTTPSTPPAAPPSDTPAVVCPDGYTAVPYGDRVACLPPQPSPSTTENGGPTG